MALNTDYFYSFPAIMGVQAGRIFYVTTLPFRLVPKLFYSDDSDEVPAELRAQRKVNKVRVPAIARYIAENDDFVFSALTASISDEVQFISNDNTPNTGVLNVPMDSQILLNDGQHRRAAIELAIKEDSLLASNMIGVLFFVDEGLQRSQQIFADLNAHASKPSPSLNTLYDLRDHSSKPARMIAKEVVPFSGFTEMERSAIGAKSSKLFTLSAIKQATAVLLGKKAREKYLGADIALACDFWQGVAQYITEWTALKNGNLAASDIRAEYIHGHNVALLVLASAGNSLIEQYPENWKDKLSLLKDVNWKKSNAEWARRCMNNGRVQKSSINIKLGANYIKKILGVELTEDESVLELCEVRG